MSHESPHVKRHQRAQRRLRRKPQEGLMLTALIDIFANLLFFLLVISQNPSKLPNLKDLQLPSSSAEKVPKETLVVMVTKKEILVQDVHIATITEAMGNKDDLIPALAVELKYRASKSAAPLNEQGIPEREITIIGDRNTPYSVLRKVMATCSENDYAKMSFAVARGDKKS
ncbi:MAG TPA: biopolymer transporter ExbD [Fluviicoccus sp.]|nr:biopolymer transporter ExbD [Fluviicoccus sp.]